ncbi:serine/threonine-protein kinase [Urbifossiella limnaea]|uniref:Serine/threonine-protein kinase PknB n=1 Tax=Urbifossiella limnaea TaxID=2528023 RepID=A0A517XTS9_9BACT|nr:serine/threonine-protein kinase [Urbifossiella limnaea]QDU20913.1 Serine/threonine-protein kinase PknB [Urbifossiella limnaea]
MPAPATVPEFLDLVRKSGLLPDATVDEVIDRHRAAGTLPTTLDPTAALFVREGLLTFFQAKQLKLGRYKRFTIGSKYRLLELIGAGGMGAVYLCEHTLMKRLVALKVLPVEKLEDPSNLERFHREARAVAALDHPNIVRAYDIDVHDKLHFLVMEYVDGCSLQDIVARHGPMDPVRAAHYVAQSAVGIQHAHELGMVHRDIKPGNLLLERTGVVKILDMGLARFFNKPTDSVTEKYDDKCVLGTADYLAPEQAVSNTVDVRADIYSLGGTLYYLLTGQTPFPDGTIAAKLVAHQTRDPKPIEAYRSDVPQGILDVLQVMMAKNADDRYQSPIEVADALAEWADLPSDPPPAKEMPGLCPLVLALTGHAVDKASGTGASVPLGRALFGPGRSALRGGGTGSSGRMVTGGSGRFAPASGRVGVAGNSSPRNPPAGSPKSTTRNAAAATAPMRQRPSPEPITEPTDSSATDYRFAPQASSRRGLYVASAVAVGLVFCGAIAAGAYFLGKGQMPDGVTTKGTGPDDARRAPTLTEAAFAPEATAQLDGKVCTVEFRVAAVGGGDAVCLKSTIDDRAPTAFVAKLDRELADPANANEVAIRFDGKTVRVRGTVQKTPSGPATVEVETYRQLLVVPR